MNSSVNSVNAAGTAFRANATNEHGQQYYKSNKGTIAGAILAVPAVYYNIKPAFFDFNKFTSSMGEYFKKLGLSEKEFEQAMKKAFPNDYMKVFERSKQLAIPFALIAGACTLGAGVLFDRVRNKKASVAAKDLADGNYGGIYANGGAVDFSPTGVPYYKSTNAVKYGFLTGMACGVVQSVMDYAKNRNFNGKSSLLNVIIFGLGGVIMSSIAQKAANKAAEKSTYA